MYTAPAAGVPRGTVVGFRADSLRFTHPGRFQLATDGDQLLAYQGPEAAPVFVAGLALKKDWSSVVSANTSALPPGLVAGSSALYLPWANGAYPAAQARQGTVAGLRAALADATHWAGGPTRQSWPRTPFAVEATYLTPPPAGADSLRLDQYHTLALLDVSQVPGGLLAEYGMPLVPPGIFDGTLTDSSRTNDGVFRQLFATLATSRVYGPNRFPRLDTLMDRLDRRAAAPDGVIPIAIERIDYATLRPDALAAGLLSWQNNQLYDVPGRSQSPYLARTAFVAGPARTYSPTGNVTLLIPAALHMQVGGGTPQTPEIDFGDGRGYLPAAWDQPISVAYCDSGTHRIKLRLAYVLAGATAPTMTYESHFDLQVRHPGCTAARYTRGPDLQFPMQGFRDTGRGGKVSIRYGGNHTGLIKPLIVVEGYDPDYVAPKVGKGNYSVEDFLDDVDVVDFSGGFRFNFSEVLEDTDPANTNRPANYVPYDIVFIDFNDGTDDIRRNAKLFKEVVRWVNLNKLPNASGQVENNVVLGISMGGLVARYGLAQMEKTQSGSTETRLLMTQDSPHRGANTPFGVQALARQAYNAANIITVMAPLEGLVLRAIFPQLDQVIAIADAPATRQLLLLYAEDGTGTTTTDGFLAGDYRTTITFPAGGPQPPYRFIATSLGSQCGVGVLTPYSELARVEGGAFMKVGSFLKADYRLSFVVNALPNYGTAERVSGLRLFVNYKVFGTTVATHTLFSQTFASPSNVPGWDGAPGGTQPVRSRLPLAAGIYPPLDFLGMTGGDLNIQAADNFCFVPTVSALDIADINASTLAGKYVGGLASSSFSRAANFMAQPALGGQYNYQHPFFLGREAHWLFNEMENISTSTPLNCSNACTAFTIANSLAPQRLCGPASATFSIPNLPVGATVDWSATPPGNFTVATGSGPTFTTSASANAVGNGTITAIIGQCRQVASLTLRTGSGEPNGYYTSAGNSAALTTYQTVGPGGVDGTDVGIFINDPYNFSFTSDMPGLSLTNTQGNSTHFILKQGQGVTITATATNASPCGVVGHYVFVYPGGYHLAFAPNPATTELTVTAVDASQPTASGASTTAPPFDADLYNSQGKKVKTGKSVQGRARIDVRDLPTGLYHLRAGKGKEALSEQIQIDH